MNPNAESHFSTNPVIKIGRSKFNVPYTRKMTFNSSDLVPLSEPFEVLPGDTFTVDMGAAVRMTTPVFPVMDDSFLDIFYFFVPTRLLWIHWEEFNGANKSTYWDDPTEYSIPQITAPAGGWSVGSIADYFGLPIGIDNISVSSLPFRGYALIWNEWFRSENVSQPCNVNTDDATVAGSNDGDYVINGQLGGKPLKVTKFYDYFTSCLPKPQKGDPVNIPGTVVSGTFPVVTGSTDHVSTYLNPLRWVGDIHTGPDAYLKATSTGTQSVISHNAIGADQTGNIAPANLEAVIDSASTSAVSINELRQAFAVQRLLEADARGGTRYTEVLRSHFGVMSPDGRLQRPEFLGSQRVHINVDQVLQTSSTDTTSPQGNTAAYSLTNVGSSGVFTQSFTEHGYIFVLGCIRTNHTYQQGISRMWSRKSRYDFYWPELANIGEQPVYNREIYAQGSNKINNDTGKPYDDEVFGYQEAYADYRYKPSQVCGVFRSTAPQPLDSWHYGDYYTSMPYLSHDWLSETDANIYRTLAVHDEPQFLADFYFKWTVVRPMPLYSIPGLIGHF
nr:MAG: major capsid protein [Microviridae sp.]